jgi:hypothetical protein
MASTRSKKRRPHFGNAPARWKEEVELAALSAFSSLTERYGYAGPIVQKNDHSTSIGYVRGDIAIEVRLDWIEADVSLFLARPTRDGKLPSGYYLSDAGELVRVYLVTWLWRRGLFKRRKLTGKEEVLNPTDSMKRSLADYRQIVEGNLAEIERHGHSAFEPDVT